MRKEKILEILENAKDGNGAVPMRLVRTAFDKLPEPCEDTISRQAAIDALDKQIKQCCKALGSLSLSDVDKHAVEIEMASIRAYREMLEYLPTVQPELTDEQVEEYCKRRCLHIVTDDFCESTKPQRLGHWIRRDCGLDVECKCSKCGYRDFVEPRDEYWFKRNYCPHCGAKMKGAQNG